MNEIDHIRRCATALPGVEEYVHFRFRTPGWKVNGKPFAGLEKGETAAVFCVTQAEAAEAVTADPSMYEESWRPTNPRTFLGLRVDLGKVSDDRVRELVEHAWRHKAPKRLVASRDAQQ